MMTYARAHDDLRMLSKAATKCRKDLRQQSSNRSPDSDNKADAESPIVDYIHNVADNDCMWMD